MILAMRGNTVHQKWWDVMNKVMTRQQNINTITLFMQQYKRSWQRVISVIDANISHIVMILSYIIHVFIDL